MRPCHLRGMTVAVICCSTLLVSAQQRSADEEKILSLEKKWAESYRQHDISVLSSLLAEDFIITVEDGNTFGKEGYISHSADATVRVDVAELSELRVRFHGNTAVVTGAYHEVGASKGKHYEYRDRLTDVWMKKEGNWQVIASHYSVPVRQ